MHFGPTVACLGVAMGLSEIRQGKISVSNYPGRMEKVLEMLQPIADGKDVTNSQLASLHGLVNFAGGYILGFQ